MTERRLAPTWGALFLLALALRCRGLGRSLWYDELVTLQGFAGSLLGVFTQQIGANNHPLASLLLWLDPAQSEVGLRLPFAVLGAAACPALAWSLARWGWARSGVLAGATLAVLPAAVLLSQQARGYAGLLLCVALLPGLAARGGRLGVAVNALGVGFHLGFLLAALPWLGLRPQRLRAWLAGLALGGLACAGVYARTWHWVRRALRDGDSGADLEPLGVEALWTWLSGGSPLLGVALLAAAGLGLARLRGRERWLAAPLGGVALLLVVGVPGYPRFAAFALPCLCALVGRGLAGLPLPRVGLALVVGCAVWPLGTQANRELQDLRGAAAAVEGATPYAAGFAAESVRHYLPEVRDDLAGFLADPGPAAFVDPFPRLTPPEVRADLEAHAGPPQILSGVHPVAVYRR